MFARASSMLICIIIIAEQRIVKSKEHNNYMTVSGLLENAFCLWGMYEV
jgi:hypothetical protein